MPGGAPVRRSGVRRSFAFKEDGEPESGGPEFLGDLDWAAEAAGAEPRLSGFLYDPADLDGQLWGATEHQHPVVRQQHRRNALIAARMLATAWSGPRGP
jgi:hypothetical protein